jgi:hypothetical protein
LNIGDIMAAFNKQFEWKSCGITLSVAATILFLSSCKVADNPGDTGSKSVALQAGRWETQYRFTEVDLPGLKRSQRDRIASEISKLASGASCLSPGLRNQPNASFFGGEGTSDCSYTQYEVVGGVAKIKLSCNMKGFGTVDIDSSGPIEQDRYDVRTEIGLRLPLVGRINLRGSGTGRYTGACRGDE